MASSSPGISDRSKAIKKIKRGRMIIPIKKSLIREDDDILKFEDKRPSMIIEINQEQIKEQ